MGKQGIIHRAVVPGDGDAHQPRTGAVHMGIADGGRGGEGVPAVMRRRPGGGRASHPLTDTSAESLVAFAGVAGQPVKIGKTVEIAVGSKGEQVGACGVVDTRAQEQFEVSGFFEDFGDGLGFEVKGVTPVVAFFFRPQRHEGGFAPREDGFVVKLFDDVWQGCIAHAGIVDVPARADE